ASGAAGRRPSRAGRHAGGAGGGVGPSPTGAPPLSPPRASRAPSGGVCPWRLGSRVPTSPWPPTGKRPLGTLRRWLGYEAVPRTSTARKVALNFVVLGNAATAALRALLGVAVAVHYLALRRLGRLMPRSRARAKRAKRASGLTGCTPCSHRATVFGVTSRAAARAACVNPSFRRSAR